jgi:hypothetical protein
MPKKIAIALLVVVVVSIALFFFLMKGPDLSQYEPLKEPRITIMKDQKVVVVEAKGDPNVVGSRAFGLLFKTYYKLDGVAKGPKQPAPRARWSGDMNNKSTWIGRYALPVPDQVASLPAIDAEPGFKVDLGNWEYGQIAEILHIGPYAQETPTIEKLMKFINDNGYTIVGYHEEEYLKGPGMFFKGNPDQYYTIIRYRVAKAAAPRSRP